MFFNSYTSAQSKKRVLIDSFYYKIVNVSRSKDFYEKLLVPDTIDGRYDLLVLFSIILTFNLSKCGNVGKDLSQNLFDKIFLDLDLSLRELGAGDAGVHIKIKQMINFWRKSHLFRFCLGPKTKISHIKITISAQVCISINNFPLNLNLSYSLNEARLAMGRTKIGRLVVDDENGVK